MPVTAIDDVLDAVDYVFWRNRPLITAISAIDELDEKFAQLAKDKKFWIIGKAQKKLVKHLKSEVSPELLHALAQRIPLEPESIFDQLGCHPECPEVDIALVQNLLRHDRVLDHDAELDEYLREFVGQEDLDDHVITIIDDIMRRGNDWECWIEPVNTVLYAALHRHDNDKYRDWFVQNESRMLEIDGSTGLCSRWEFRTCFELYEWGLHDLGRQGMERSAGRAKNFEFLTHEALLESEKTQRNFAFLDKHPSLCFLLASTSPIESWKSSKLDFTELAKCLDTANSVHRSLDPARVTYAALKASETLSDWQLLTLIKTLLACGYPQSEEVINTLCTNVAKRYLGDPMAFCRLFVAARELGVNFDLTSHAEWPMATLMEGARRLSHDDIMELLRNYSVGMNLPRLVMEAGVDHSYDRWPEAKQNEVRKIAPEWLLSHSERMREDKLFTDMGL
jgi:hypothetical protein